MMRILATTALVLTLVAAAAIADRVETVNETVDSKGARQIEVDFEFGAGELYVRGADIEHVTDMDITYSPRWVDYHIDYALRGSRGLLTLESDIRDDGWRDGDLENEWRVTLSKQYPMLLDLEFGACEADIDLGGLSIEGLIMEIGASSGRLDFSQPNPIVMEELDIETGASSMEIFNLGNARFEHMRFEGGAMSCEMDFSGDFQGEADVELEVGVGSMEIYIPRDIAVRVESDDGWFSSVDFHDLDLDEVDRGVYESRNFRRAEKRIVFYLEVGMGSVDFYASR